MLQKKLQIALEFLIIFSFVLVVFMFLFVLVASERTQTLSGQIFSQEQLIAQSVAQQLDRALQAGNGYSARIPMTGSIGTSGYTLVLTKNGAVIVNTNIGSQVIQAIAYSSVKNLVSNATFLSASNPYYSIPISNGTLNIVNSFGTVCVDYACPSAAGSNQPSNLTISMQGTHAAQFGGLAGYIEGLAAELPSGTVFFSSPSAFAWVRTTSTARETIFSYGTSSSGDALTMDVNDGSSNGDFSVDFSGDVRDSGIPINDGKWHSVGFTLLRIRIIITINIVDMYVDGQTVQKVDLSGASIPTGTTFQIGRWVSTGTGDNSGHLFSGSIANLQFYSAGISSPQANTIYQGGITGFPINVINSQGASSLVGWWPLNGDPNDYSGYGYNGVAVGPVLYTGVAQLNAQVKNQQGNPDSNVLVGFESTAGNFTTNAFTVGITNSSGIATAFINQQQQNGQALVKAYAFNGNVSSPLAGNLIGWWPLGMGIGNYTYDLSGNAMVTDGDVGGANGIIGWSYPAYSAVFNGKNSYVYVPASPLLSMNRQSWSFWFQPSALSSNQNILGIGNPNAGSPTGFATYISPSLGLSFNSMAVQCNTNARLLNNTWYEVALTWDGSTLTCYLDGVAQNSISSGFSGTITATGSPAYLGTDSYTPAKYFFQGKIANVQVYNVLLTQSQVLQSFQGGLAGLPVNSVSTVAWLPLGGDSKDYSNNNNNGTIIGNLNFVSSSLNTSISANATSMLAANFNGVAGSYISFNSLPAPPGDTGFSVSTWARVSNYPGTSSSFLGEEVGTTSAGVFDLGIDGSGYLHFGWDGCGTIASNANMIPANWYNVVAVYNSLGSNTIYIDGVQSGFGGVLSLCNQPTANLTIGRGANGAFSGMLSGVEIYNSTLTQAQALQIYQAGITAPPLNSSTLNPKISGWYPLEGNTSDFSGNAHNGNFPAAFANYQQQLVVSPPLSAYASTSLSKFGVNFNGQSGSYASIPSAPLLNPANGITITAWAYAAPVQPLGPGNSYGVAEKWNQYGLRYGPNGVSGLITTSGGTCNPSFSRYVASNWNFIALTYNDVAPGNAIVYLNGVAVNTIGCSGLISSSANPLLIGGNQGGSYLNGSIADVQMYNNPLTTLQISQIYKSGPPPVASATVPLSWIP